jgi:hypothetical protein
MGRKEGGRERRMRDMVYILLWYSFWWYLYPVPESSKQLMYSCYDHAIYWVRHTPTQTWRGYSRYNNVTHPSTVHFSFIQLARKQGSHCIDIAFLHRIIAITMLAIAFRRFSITNIIALFMYLSYHNCSYYPVVSTVSILLQSIMGIWS